MNISKIKILELRTVSGTGGGPEKTIFLTAKKINPRRFETHIIYSRNKNDPQYNWMIRNRRLPEEVYYYDYIEKHPFDIGLLRYLLNYCRKYKIDILHSHEYKTDVIAGILKRFLAIRWVSTFHAAAFANLKLKIYQYLAYQALKKADLVVTVSHHQKELLKKKGLPLNILSTLPNGIDTNVFKPDTSDLSFRKKWDIPRNALVLGFLGRLSVEKNIPLLITVFKRLNQKRDNVFLVLGGEGSEREKIENLIDQNNLNDKTRLVGFIENPIPLYKSIDIFVICSTTEVMPNSVLEAMAMELPVVATEVGGLSEVISPNQEGFLTPSGSVEGLYSSILKLIENHGLRKKMGKMGREKVIRQYSFDGRVKKLEKIYEKLYQE